MFVVMAQADPQRRCRACASQIPQGAKLCPVCKTYQERWKAIIQFLSPATALLVATISFALWGVSQLPTIRVMFWPREDVRLVAANSMHGGVVVNLGDEEIFVTHAALYMTGRTNWTGQVFPINELVGRAKFLRIQPPPAPGGAEGTFIDPPWISDPNSRILASVVATHRKVKRDERAFGPIE
jgi:predicted nucleic acid-binding Zn ribbon protein